jgi:large repetitive protein
MQQRTISLVTSLAWLVAAGMLSSVARAEPPLAGTIIENRISATFVDASTGITSTLDSNIVRVHVARSEALTLTAPNTLSATANFGAHFAHRLTNTGNAPTDYRVTFANESGDDFDLVALRLVRDTISNGRADQGEPNVAQGEVLHLEPGASLDLVLVGTVPATTPVARVARALLTATSTTQASISANNRDSVTTSAAAVLTLEKRASATTARPGDEILYTLLLGNTATGEARGVDVTVDDAPAALVVVRDAIPTNTTFVTATVASGATRLYHLAGDSLHQYVSATPTDLARVDAIAFGFASVPGTPPQYEPAAPRAVSFRVRINGNAAGRVDNRAEVYYVNDAAASTIVDESNMTLTGLPNRPIAIDYYADATFVRVIGVTSVARPLFVEVSAAVCNLEPLRIETRRIIITSQRTDDSESFSIVETGINTGVFRASGLPTHSGNAVAGNGTLEVQRNDVLTAQVPGCGDVQIDADILIDPEGVVFDSRTGEPVLGAVVRLLDVTGAGNGGNAGGNATVFATDGVTPAPSIVTTNVDGRFSFPTVRPSSYRLVVTAPPGYSMPSTTPQALLARAPDGFAYTINVPGSYGGDFPLNPSTGAVKLDVPLDKHTGLVGVAFDSLSDAPLANATVTLLDGSGAPARVFAADSVTLLSNVVVTGSDGRYVFPFIARGDYQLRVVRAGYRYPSQVPAEQLPPGHTVELAGSYAAVFTQRSLSGNAIVDVPLDSDVLTGLQLEKSTTRSTAELGDLVDYTIRVRNTARGTLAGIELNDMLPAGFGYHAGSARLNGLPIAEPTGAKGRGLTFAIGAIPGGQSASLTYRVHLGPGAQRGDGINRVTATAGAVGSNLASVKVAVNGGVFSEKGFVLGRVFADCDTNGTLGADDAGVPGVRVYLEDGTYAITDIEGRYSFYGLAPRTHVLKVDTTTLPEGFKLVPIDHRNAGNATLRFVDLKNGELQAADFVGGACTISLMGQIHSRRQSADLLFDEAERAVRTRISASGEPLVVPDPRALPSSGIVGERAAAENAVFAAIALSVPLSHANSALPPEPAIAVPAAPLEDLLDGATTQLGFAGFKDSDTVPVAQTRVVVKGPIGTLFSLTVNQRAIAESRVGRRVVVPARGVEAWEYIGIDLQPGANKLEVCALDEQGKPGASVALSLVAPDTLAQLEIEGPAAGSPADGVTRASIAVRLRDREGVPVTVRTPITLETTLGRFDVEDLNSVEDGVQTFISGGAAEFAMIAPIEPGRALLRVSAGVIKDESELDFLPDLRPLVGAGILEGTLSLRSVGRNSIVPTRANDGFEQELRAWSTEDSNDERTAAARAAFFLKGKVLGKYLLTAAFDSDKNTRERLFRDIQPDEFYPVYGDSAVKGFDAQSTGRFYVRIDRDRSYALYGDYTVQSQSPARQLANYSRSFSGLKHHYESEHVAINTFASRDRTRQVVEELPSNGTSGPFFLSRRDVVGNSERVEILTRDRNQPSLVLESAALTRFIDYDFEPLSGRLLLRRAQASIDATLNPFSIRVTYEVDQGGDEFWVVGADAQFKIADRFEVGATYVRDGNPQGDANGFGGTAELIGVNASAKLGSATHLTVEAARAESFTVTSGDAHRIELRHDSARLQGRAYVGETDAGFDNASSTLNRGRAEAGARATYKIDEHTRLIGEALRTGDTTNGGVRDGATLAIERSFDRNRRLEFGLRRARETVAAASATTSRVTPNDYSSARVRATSAVPYVKRATLYGEYEQDIEDSERKVLMLGGDYQIADRAKLYARHELISTLDGPYTLNTQQRQNTTVFGLDSDYSAQGRLFSEYRVRDAISAREAQAAVGLRNRWRLRDGLAIDAGFERVDALEGSSASESASLNVGVEYTARPDWKAAGRAEFHRGSTTDTALLTLGIATKLDNDWTFLGKNVTATTRTTGAASGDTLDQRLQIGFAYRDPDDGRLSILSRLEHRFQQEELANAAPTQRQVMLLSNNLHYVWSHRVDLSARLAAKWVADESNGLDTEYDAELVSGRVTYDIADRWDVSLLASTLRSGASRARERGVGLEVGYLLTANLWLSAGYNVVGFNEDDLTGEDYTNRGAFLRFRFKFDEDVLATRLESGASTSGQERKESP